MAEGTTPPPHFPDRSVATLAEAHSLARTLVKPGELVAIYQHTGGRRGGRFIPPTNRLLVIVHGQDPPRWTWTKVDVVVDSAEL